LEVDGLNPVTRRFREKVRSAVRLLRGAGIWEGKIARLRSTAPEEAQSIIGDLRNNSSPAS